MIKAIPWEIDGMHFRSKLEARWYLVLKMLFPNLQIEYEPQAFELIDAYGGHYANYLPDFSVGLRGGEPAAFIEIKPLIATYDDRDRSSIWNAMVLGYSVPTMVIFGYPKQFYAVECKARHKGSPEGNYIGSTLEPVSNNFYLSGYYPDEYTMPTEFPISDFFQYENQFPKWKEVEKQLQWMPKKK